MEAFFEILVMSVIKTADVNVFRHFEKMYMIVYVFAIFLWLQHQK